MDKVDKLDAAVKRLMRRSDKTTTVIIPPYPISGAAAGNVSGDVLHYMFPGDGTITRGIIDFVTRVKDNVEVEVKLFGETTGSSNTFFLDKRINKLDLNMEVKAGDRLLISVKPVNPEVVINEVWLTLLWIPLVKDSEIKQFLINDLEAQIASTKEIT